GPTFAHHPRRKIFALRSGNLFEFRDANPGLLSKSLGRRSRLSILKRYLGCRALYLLFNVCLSLRNSLNMDCQPARTGKRPDSRLIPALAMIVVDNPLR